MRIRSPPSTRLLSSNLYHPAQSMTSSIQAYLRDIAASRGIEILYACESGSRAWGFASPDSDYDIRFIFRRGPSSYLSTQEGLESIDLPLKDGLLDAGGWDIRKAARLLGKSNGALVEWLHSPIVYFEQPGFLDRWRPVARETFAPRASRDHYLGLARQMVLGKLQNPEVRAKDYLYALRAILCAAWVTATRSIPPVEFSGLTDLSPPEVRAALPALLAHKAGTSEGQLMPRVEALDLFLQQQLTSVPPLPSSPVPVAALDALFRSEVRHPLPLLQPADLTLDRVRRPDLLLFDTVAGSHAYGTAGPDSDQDRRGIFVAPSHLFLQLTPVEQVSDPKNDHVYYEIGHFLQLLLRNNPNALEILTFPDDVVLYRHPLFHLLRLEDFLSKRCAVTFGEYALGQIRKARGLNKKIVNPQPEQRLTLLDFCFVPHGQGSLPVLEWLRRRGLEAGACGLTAVQHAAGLYAIYDEPRSHLRGIVSPKDPDTLVFSSVPREAEPIAWMNCNHDAFRAHCKNHREYWEWVRRRNEARYLTNVGHGRGYDSKNLMHTIRLLEMAREIAVEGVLRARRPNRGELLRIRRGKYDYETLVDRAESLHQQIQSDFARSSLPDHPDPQKALQTLLLIREGFGPA